MLHDWIDMNFSTWLRPIGRCPARQSERRSNTVTPYDIPSAKLPDVTSENYCTTTPCIYLSIATHQMCYHDDHGMRIPLESLTLCHANGMSALDKSLRIAIAAFSCCYLVPLTVFQLRELHQCSSKVGSFTACWSLPMGYTRLADICSSS